jgi:GIY-YIG catalytic domain
MDITQIDPHKLPGLDYPVLFRSRVQWPVDCCLYFLWNHGRLVYIGVTGKLVRRLNEHYRGKSGNTRKAFDRVTWLEYPDRADLENAETELLTSLRPIHNRKVNGK